MHICRNRPPGPSPTNTFTGVGKAPRRLPGEPPTSPATEPVVSLRLQTSLGEVKLFTVIATVGAPLEVTAASLAIETFLPMDPESTARLRALAESAEAAQAELSAK